jgi:hypothetical protein
VFRITLTDQTYATHGYEAYLSPACVAMVMKGRTFHTIVMTWGQRFFVPLAEEPTLMELVAAVRRVSGDRWQVPPV